MLDCSSLNCEPNVIFPLLNYFCLVFFIMMKKVTNMPLHVGDRPRTDTHIQMHINTHTQEIQERVMHPQETHTQRYTQIYLYIFTIYIHTYTKELQERELCIQRKQTLPNRKHRICAATGKAELCANRRHG